MIASEVIVSVVACQGAMPSSGSSAHRECKRVTRAASPGSSVACGQTHTCTQPPVCVRARAAVLVATHNGARLMLTTPFSEYGYQLPLTSGAHEFSYASGAPRARPRAMKPTEAVRPSLFFSLRQLRLGRESERAPLPGPKNARTINANRITNNSFDLSI